MMIVPRMIAAAALAWIAHPALASDKAASAPDMAIILSPGAANSEGQVTSIGVVVTFEEAPQSGPLAEMPLLRNTVPTSADDLGGLAFSDARGLLPVSVDDLEEDESNRTRRWTAQRAPEGTVTLAYTVTINPDLPLFSRPQYELRTREGTFSGAGLAFLALPSDSVARDVTIRWNLVAMESGATGISSLGIGDISSTRPQTPQELAQSYYMAGSARTYEADGFFAGWDGEFAFPGEKIMRWASDLHHFYGDFFERHPDHFGVFARVNEANPGSGIGLNDSFAFTFDSTLEMEELKGLLAHEMLHAWVNSLDNSMDQAAGFASSWFGEGLAVHYQRLLPYRAGLMSSEQFLDDLNSTAGRYYTNIMIGTPNDQIGAGFWRDTRIRVLPYDRGSLYFAQVDAEIRAASGGERSLDDIVREMLAVRAAGQPMNLALWERLLQRDLGKEGLTRFHAMLAGEQVLPPSDAFGPCFRRTTKPLRRFDLGFDPASLLTPERVVGGLKPGSNAEIAGLRDGDRILNTFSQDGLQGDQQRELTLEIDRAGERLSITYRPRGEEVEAYQWEAQPCGTDGK